MRFRNIPTFVSSVKHPTSDVTQELPKVISHPKVEKSDHKRINFPLLIEHESDIQINLFSFDVYVKENKSFKADLPNIAPNLLSLKTREDCLRLTRKPLTFYQNQFNMAVWFATTGCGISVNDHLNHKIPMIRSLYRFHTYYQIMKIFKNLQIPVPGDSSFSEFKNNMNVRKYNELLSEFGLKDEYDFSVFAANNGWSSWSVPDYDPNITDPGYYINDSKINFFLMQVHENRTPPMFQADWDNGMENFKYPDTFIKYHVNQHKNIINVMRQKPCQTYQQFMRLSSHSLTSPGIARLNDSIRTYVYCILGAQALTRTPITGSFGTELDAQKQFIKLLDDSVNQHADIPTSIARYQKSLSDTHKRLDYVIGPGLYIIPSDMVLNIGTIVNYNNNILIATENMTSGKNDINSEKNTAPPMMQGPAVKKSVLKTNGQMKHEKNITDKELSLNSIDNIIKSEPTISESKTKSKATLLDTHDSMKFYLFVLTGGLVTLALYSHHVH